MVDPQLVSRRLVAQHLAAPQAEDPHAVVSELLAMQGQDLPGVISSIALRLGPGQAGGEARGREGQRAAISTDVDARVQRVLDAFDDGSVVRGYPMRGTVFAVAAEDLRWLTELCAPGPTKAQIARRPMLGLDDEQVARARSVLERAAGGEAQRVTRAELFRQWENAGLDPAGGRGYHLLSHLIATGIAAYGPWNGTEMDVVLTELWLPAGSSIAERFGGDRRSAVAELLERYLRSHGPASLRDVAWWTKLPLRDLRAAIPLVEDRLESGTDAAGEQVFWRPGLDEELAAAGERVRELHLLPGFDELVLGYPDRTVLLDEEHHPLLAPGNNGIFARAVLRRGRIIGTWKRAGRPGRRTLELRGFRELPAVAEKEAAKAYARFPHVGE